MKVFLSCDIEGTNGIAAWEETDKPKAAYPVYAERMTWEVGAACAGINQAAPGCDIVIKDAHDSARNLNHELLPQNTRLIRGWGASPYTMMFGIDPSFDAAMFTGYHSGGGFNGSPLAHTMSHSGIFHVKINGAKASEFLINYYAALYNRVPVVLVTGDEGLCRTVREIDPAIVTVASYTGVGGSVCAEHPEVTRAKITEAAREALSRRDKVSMTLPRQFQTEICYRDHPAAARAAHYPGAFAIDPDTVGFDTGDYYEFLRFFFFV